MKKILVEREVWQAKDGKEFQTEDECREYELQLLKPESLVDPSFGTDLTQFLKENKSELFRIMGWGELKRPLMLKSMTGWWEDNSVLYKYELSEGLLKGKYSGTLFVQDSEERSYGYDLPDIGDMVLEIREVRR